MRLTSFFLLTTIWSIGAFARQAPSLLVPSGKTVSIPAREHTYDTLEIQENGVLKILGGREWAVINVNVLIVNGRVEYRGLMRGAGVIRYSTKENDLLEHQFPEQSKGGAGGDAVGIINFQGGKGYSSTNAEGGGGGSGAQFFIGLGKGQPGRDATGRNGATAAIDFQYSNGGDGGFNNTPHGGLLYINANTISNGEFAMIDLSGYNGDPGSNGMRGKYHYEKVQAGPGGGGGGSAGGDGGVLRVRFRNMNREARTNVMGGNGGQGGAGGSSSGTSNFDARPGKVGQNGINGHVDWIKKN